MKQLQLTARAFLSVSASLSDEVVLSLQIKAPGGEGLKVIGLEYEGHALSRPATAVEGEACPKDHCSLVWRAEAPRRSSVDSIPVKKRNPLFSMKKTGGQSGKAMRNGKNEAGFLAELGPSPKAEDVIDATPADSGAPFFGGGIRL